MLNSDVQQMSKLKAYKIHNMQIRQTVAGLIDTLSPSKNSTSIEDCSEANFC